MSKEEMIRMWVAFCLTCLIGEAMKDCANCAFRCGLKFKSNLTPIEALNVE